MRFVIAIVLFVGAFLSIGYGLAQRTVLAGPDELVATTDAASTEQITLIRGETLNARPDNQRITLTGEGPISVAYGRTSDVVAWIGETGYNDIGFDEETGELTTEVVDGSQDAIPAIAGSDLWLGEEAGEESLTMTINAPEDVSIIVTGAPAEAVAAPAEGEEAAEPETVPAPSDVAVRWPVDNSTPWSGPLILGGSIALLLGLVAFIWALVHARRRRGPRRKTPRLPRPPKPPRLTARSQRQPKAVTSGDRRAGRRLTLIAPTLLVPALILTGCTSGGPISELLGATPTPTPTPTAAPEGPTTEAVAVTARQFRTIIGRVTTSVAEADAAGDADLADDRLDGPALELRTAAYAMRANDDAIPLPPAIPTGDVEVLLPQQNDGWPRTVFAVVRDAADETIAPQALMLTQETPRDQYKVGYAITLEPSATVPDVAAADVGASRLGGSFSLLRLEPEKLANAYSDILANDAESEFAELFEAEGDSLRTELGLAYKNERVASLPASAALTFSSAVGTGPTIAFGTTDTGAIVAVHEYEVETVKPSEAGAAINPGGSVKALSGKESTTTGITATYGLQMLFYVPSVTAEDQKIQLLGFSQGLVKAEETG